MKPEEQRIAIALRLGATWQHNGSGVTRLTFRDIWKPIPSPINPDKISISGSIPDYLNDLNAMHDAEKLIVGNESSIIYFSHLNRIALPWYATAAQRAEAFLKTMNLWTE